MSVNPPFRRGDGTAWGPLRLVVIVFGFLAATAGLAAGEFEAGLDAYDKGDFERAFSLWEPLARSGNADAQNNLGWLYENGEGVVRDLEQALHWYRLAAGGSGASENVARIEAILGPRGEAVAVSAQPAAVAPATAPTAVPAASAKSPIEVGIAAYDRRDFDAAIAAWRPLAENGNADAQNNLGWMHERGEGVPRDLEQALAWYSAAARTEPRWGENRDRVRRAIVEAGAAAAGDLGLAARPEATARVSLQGLFEQAMAHHDAQRFDEALELLRRLARLGYARAQTNLGYLYSSGKGVPADHAAAREWYLAAAVQGESYAQNNLAAMLAAGQGGTVDVVSAYTWFSVASNRGHLEARANRAALRGLLSDEERTLADRQAGSFEPVKGMP